MEYENIEGEQNSNILKDQFMTVTPLSKYLALILFIALPFIGGYLGYIFSPEKIVEVKKIVEADTQTATEETSNDLENTTSTKEDLWVRYIHPAGFALMIPRQGSVTKSKEEVSIDVYGNGLNKDIYFRENLGGVPNIENYIAEIYGSDCEIELNNEDIMGYGVSTYSIFGDYPGNTSDCRNGKNTKLLYSHTKDLAVTWTGSMDGDDHLYMLETIHISSPAYGE